MTLNVWWNEEILPTENQRQKHLNVHLPRFFLWGASLSTKVGYFADIRTNFCDGLARREFHFVILGLGLSYTENWDV